MMKRLVVALVMTVATASTFATHAAREKAEKVIEMKDGSTLYIFKGGKMAMEDKFGRVTRMKNGVVMESKDGQKIIMYGDEVGRLQQLLKEGHTGG